MLRDRYYYDYESPDQKRELARRKEERESELEQTPITIETNLEYSDVESSLNLSRGFNFTTVIGWSNLSEITPPETFPKKTWFWAQWSFRKG